jgi:NADPH:quinone reductase-like Zn-dependent oxidoreductase
MEAYRIDRFGSVDGIVLRSSEDPRPGPKEILMRVRASSLNYRDLMVLKGGGRGPTKLSFELTWAAQDGCIGFLGNTNRESSA